MLPPSSAPIPASPWLDRDLLPALGAAAVSALLLSVAGIGAIGWSTALLMAAFIWAG